MIQKIFKTGNNVVVTLPEEALEALNLREGESVSVELDATRGQIVISPADSPVEGIDVEFAKQVADFIDQYRPALEALAR